MNTILGFEFESKSVPFGVFKMFQSLCVGLISLLQGYAVLIEGLTTDEKRKNYIIYLCVMCAFGVLSEVMLLFFPYKTKEETGEKKTHTIEA